MNNVNGKNIPYTLRAMVRHDNDSVSLEWAIEGHPDTGDPEFEPYLVAQNRLYDCGDQIRRILDDLQASLSGTKGAPSNKTMESVRRLAWGGAEFYDVVTCGRAGDNASKLRADEFRDWFERVVVPAPHGQWRIQIEHENFSTKVLPWGLIFPPPQDRSIDDLSDTLEDFSSFWCMSYFLACSGPTQQEAANNIRSAEQFVMAAIIELDNNQVEEYLKINTINGALDRDEINNVFGTSSSNLRRIAGQSSNQSRFWYVSLKAKDGAYRLSKHELLENHFANPAELGVKESGVGMVLLDGDAVIRGDRGSDWVKEILHAPRTGMIAVETDISNPHLKFGGWDFLQSIIYQKDKTFLWAIHHSRQQYWPFCLLYGVYSNPLYLSPAPPHELADDISAYLEFVKSRITTDVN